MVPLHCVCVCVLGEREAGAGQRRLTSCCMVVGRCFFVWKREDKTSEKEGGDKLVYLRKLIVFCALS